MTTIQYTKYNPYSEIKICQISDIHWRGQQRHEEYVAAFEKLFIQLKEKKVNAIVCTGDIVHTKTQNITPEIIDKLVWMFRGLAKIAPLHIILGNHDGNLANEDRQDVISPILNAMGGGYRTFFYKKSGVYPLVVNHVYEHEDSYDGIKATQEMLIQAGWLSVFSLFDKESWGNVTAKNESGFFDIALFHGAVKGCLTDGDFQLTECDTDVNYFNKYDIAMLGDIHKQQFLGWKSTVSGGIATPWIGYPGSLIQQNYGEVDKKGWYLWKLRSAVGVKKDWTAEFIELPNMMPFVTVEWKGDVKTTVEDFAENFSTIKNSRVRISSKQNISQTEVSLLYKELKEKLGASEVTFKQEEIENIDNVQTETVSISKHSLRNDTVALRKLYREYVKNSKEKHVLTEEKLLKAETHIEQYVKNLLEAAEEEVTRDVQWTLKGMEFNNLFCYGEGNKINFGNMNGIVGVFSPNATGKSSIVGSLMYGLYNVTDRSSVKSAHIVNRRKKEGSARILLNVAGTDYIVERKTAKIATKKKKVEDEDKALTSLQLYRLSTAGDMVELTSENDVKRSDTDKILRKLIGTSEDFLMTAFSNQGGINRFIEEGATVRKEILNRFLDLDIFKKLFSYADKDYSTLEVKSSKYNLSSWEDTILQLKKASEEKNEKISSIKSLIQNLRFDLDNKKIWLNENKNLNQQDLKKQMEALTFSISSVKKELLKTATALDIAKVSKSDLETRLEKVEMLLKNYDEEKIKSSVKSLQEARKAFSGIEATFNSKKNELEGMKKSVKKLQTVPCGDSFPSCHYIRDSHEDKKNLTSWQSMVEDMAESIAVTEQILKDLENEKPEEKLKNFNQGIQAKTTLEQKIVSVKKEIDLLEQNLSMSQTSVQEKCSKLKEIEDKLDLGNNEVFEQKNLECRNLEKEILQNENEMQNCLIGLGINANKVNQMEIEKDDCKNLLDDLKIFDSVRDAFSKNGIPAMVLKTQLPAINQELDKILSGVSNFRVMLETEVNTTNTLDIFISDEKSKRLIELGSGMEKMIASLAIRVALINLSSLPKPDIFIIDESFGALDQENTSKVIQLLQTLKTRFKAILLISHIPEIKEAADKILEINFSEGDSFIQA